jgi:ADP-ribose pyrophosphatase YjhB (NUDIX family)
LPDHEAAAGEAREEAGVVGLVEPQMIGTFHYGKTIANLTRSVEVSVFRMVVQELLAEWPEAHERQRRWFTLEDAAAAVAEPGLIELIAELRPAG